jgi:hypothetical protein
MENIVEIPLDAPETETEAPPDPPDPPDPPEAKRGRGRPKGAPNKPKKEPVPREPSPEPVPPPKTKAPAKRKQPVEQKAVKKKPVYESSESEDAPGKTTREIAGEVLELLSLQRANQRAQRRDRYAAWFR